MVQGHDTGVSGKEGCTGKGKRDVRSSVRLDAQNKDSGSRVKERDGWLKPDRVCPLQPWQSAWIAQVSRGSQRVLIKALTHRKAVYKCEPSRQEGKRLVG